MTDNIKMIKRSDLIPHPDNPRKDLGDLEEMRESIREHGIMQNLTVIPEGTKYKILIGHRRYAASEGILDELPCVVVNYLTYAQQVSIMLAENMQRSDLTYVEQAHGFQMMMDLGETVETISQKTGFSKATVKHRLAINELDPEALEEAKKFFQPTISDFIALEKVKDLERRNEILSLADSSKDLQESVEDYVKEMKEQEEYNYYKIIFEASGWIDETEKNRYFYYQDGFNHVDGVLDRLTLGEDHPLIKEAALKKLMDQIKGEVHFGLCYGAIMVRTYKAPKAGKNKDDAEAARKAKESRCRKNKKALKEIQAQICDAYLDFILNPGHNFKDAAEELSIIERLLGVIISNSDFSVTLYGLSNEHYSINTKVSLKDYNKMGDDHPLKEFWNLTPLYQLLVNMWWSLADNYMEFMDSYWRVRDGRLRAHREFMDILKDMGFRIKDEWKPVLDGTSDLYKEDD